MSHRIPPKFYNIPCTLTTDHLKMTAGTGRIALANALDQKKAHQTQVAELIFSLQSVLRGDHLRSPRRARRANLAEALKHKDPIRSETEKNETRAGSLGVTGDQALEIDIAESLPGMITIKDQGDTTVHPPGLLPLRREETVSRFAS
jgi:hypothetical protein